MTELLEITSGRSLQILLNENALGYNLSMLWEPKSFFPTFVVVFALLLPNVAHTAVDNPVVDVTDSAATDAPEEKPIDRGMRDSIDITQPPPAKATVLRDRPYFYRYRHGVFAYAGMLADSQASADGSAALGLFGASWSFPTEELKIYEFGVDFLSDVTANAHFARRFDFSRSRLRPFATLGAGVRVVPSDQLVTFLRFQNYQLRASAGIEDTIWDPLNIRTEIQTSVSGHSVQAGLILGLNWGY
jgi:hypothetical protein